MLFTLLFLLLCEEFQPYSNSTDYRLQVFSQLQLFLTLFGGLLIKMNVPATDSFDSAILAGVIIVLNVSVIGLTVLIFFYRHLGQRAAKVWAKLVTKAEVDDGGTGKTDGQEENGDGKPCKPKPAWSERPRSKPSRRVFESGGRRCSATRCSGREKTVTFERGAAAAAGHHCDIGCRDWLRYGPGHATRGHHLLHACLLLNLFFYSCCCCCQHHVCSARATFRVHLHQCPACQAASCCCRCC